MMKKNSPFLGKKNALKKQKIYEILEENVQMTTNEILAKANQSLTWGLTMSELSNLLARTKQFEKIGFAETYGQGGRRFRGCVWGINYE